MSSICCSVSESGLGRRGCEFGRVAERFQLRAVVLVTEGAIPVRAGRSGGRRRAFSVASRSFSAVRAATCSSASRARAWASFRSCSRSCTRSRQRRVAAFSVVSLMLVLYPVTRSVATGQLTALRNSQRAGPGRYCYGVRWWAARRGGRINPIPSKIESATASNCGCKK